jgi:ankyrin repeat protein
MSFVLAATPQGVAKDITKDELGATDLHWAVYKGQKNKVKKLIVKGADVDAKTAFGSTPLHWAAKNGNKNVVELLINAGANVNAQNYAGDTPLNWAYTNNQPSVINLLLDSGAVQDAGPSYSCTKQTIVIEGKTKGYKRVCE